MKRPTEENVYMHNIKVDHQSGTIKQPHCGMADLTRRTQPRSPPGALNQEVDRRSQNEVFGRDLSRQ